VIDGAMSVAGGGTLGFGRICLGNEAGIDQEIQHVLVIGSHCANVGDPAIAAKAFMNFLP
jgi:hypothetical protein